MFKEYDVVVAKCALSETVKSKARGTILLILHTNPNVYEIEFMDQNGNTLDILTVNEVDLEPVEVN